MDNQNNSIVSFGGIKKDKVLWSIIQRIESDILNVFDVCGIIYGSRATGDYSEKQKGKTSDLDILFAGKGIRENNEISEIIGNIVNIHKNNNFELDDEIPHRLKIYSSFNDLGGASNFKWIDRDTLNVPEIKTKEDLRSQQTIQRLQSNILTTPNIIIGNDDLVQEYLGYKGIANKNLKAIANLLSMKYKKELIDAITIGPNGEISRNYLGYKMNRDLVKEYINTYVLS